MRISLTVNGRLWEVDASPDRSLLNLLREDLALTGTKTGCDDSECGACMVLLDGQPLNSCSYLAVQADGRDVTTVEGLAHEGDLHPLQRAFVEEAAVQCGFCTPGVLISAEALLRRHPAPTDEDIRHALAGNLCRCTGYTKIVKAVRRVADELGA